MCQAYRQQFAVMKDEGDKNQFIWDEKLVSFSQFPEMTNHEYCRKQTHFIGYFPHILKFHGCNTLEKPSHEHNLLYESFESMAQRATIFFQALPMIHRQKSTSGQYVCKEIINKMVVIMKIVENQILVAFITITVNG